MNNASNDTHYVDNKSNNSITNALDISLGILSLKTLKSSEHYGHFVFQNLGRGQGITIGNQLRRVLLTDLGSHAISAVRISGITHEFAIVPGMREDVLEILLNLKGIIIKSDISTTEFGRLKVQGPSVISADSINLPANFEIVNPNHYIGTITGSEMIEMEFKIEYGTGYRLASPNSNEEKNKNFLQVDSIFMCVNRVNFNIQTIYDNENNQNNENLFLEIWTNGSISPKDAIFKAIKFILNLYKYLLTLENKILSESTLQKNIKTIPASPPIEEYLNISIEELHLSVRCYNCFKKEHINTIGELLDYPPERLLEVKNFGKKSALEIFNKLKERFGIEVAGLKK